MHVFACGAVWLLYLCLSALANTTNRLVPRSDLVTIPIHRLRARDFDNNPNTTAGLVRVSLSSNRQSYYTVVKIGDIPFRVALDTASADLWVLSSECNIPHCGGYPRFPLAYDSPTFVEVNGNQTLFEARYADGTSASGFLAKEKVELRGIAIPDQVFGLASTSNVTFTDQTSGVLGLGFSRLSSFPLNTTIGGTPFFHTLAQKGLLEYPLFALSLRRNDTGSLSIGAIDATVVKNASAINWHRVASFPPFQEETNVTRSSYLQWAIPITRLLVNTTDFQPIPSYPERNDGRSLALIDVGAAGIYGPIQDVSRLFGAIGGSRIVHTENEVQWAVPCDTQDPMSFTFGTQRYTIFPEDYLIGPVSGNPNLCLAWPRAHPPHPDAIDWQFGTAFLRTVYSIYSYGINRKESPMIGFYPIRDEALRNLTAEGSIASFFSANAATVTTTLPNVLLPTPSYSTISYIFNASITAGVGVIVESNLATSTYSPIFGTNAGYNASAIPTIAPSLVTQTFTGTEGELIVSVETQAEPAATLGIPPGWTPPGSAARNLVDSLWIAHPFVALTVVSLVLYGENVF